MEKQLGPFTASEI